MIMFTCSLDPRTDHCKVSYFYSTNYLPSDDNDDDDDVIESSPTSSENDDDVIEFSPKPSDDDGVALVKLSRLLLFLDEVIVSGRNVVLVAVKQRITVVEVEMSEGV
ncbi:hypothetical protein Tco_0044443 [Tanacetum coccineum]